MNQHRYHISAIVCTRNRAASLRRTLQALASLDLDGVGNFELIIVDNDSSDATRDVIESFAIVAPFRVCYAHEKKHGLSYARNCGIAFSSGEIVLFTDDDCYVAPDWVQVATRLFANNKLMLVGGKVESYNIDNLNVASKTMLHREELASVNNLLGFVLGANMAFGRIVISKIGRFDVRLGAGTILHAAEDTEFVYRAFVSGVSVEYNPDLCVSHDHGRSGSEVLHRLNRGYAIGNSAMMMKHALRGRFDLLKPVYWDFRSSIREWRLGRKDWRWPLLKLSAVSGAVKYILLASWKTPY